LTLPPAAVLPLLSWPAEVAQAYGLPSRRPRLPGRLTRAARPRFSLQVATGPLPLLAAEDGGEGEGGPTQSPPARQRRPWLAEALPFLDASAASAAASPVGLPLAPLFWPDAAAAAAAGGGINCSFEQPGIVSPARVSGGAW